MYAKNGRCDVMDDAMNWMASLKKMSVQYPLVAISELFLNKMGLV